eukprot:UN02248
MGLRLSGFFCISLEIKGSYSFSIEAQESNSALEILNPVEKLETLARKNLRTKF